MIVLQSEECMYNFCNQVTANKCTTTITTIHGSALKDEFFLMVTLWHTLLMHISFSQSQIFITSLGKCHRMPRA